MSSERHYRAQSAIDLQQHTLTVGETDLALLLPPGLWNDAVAAGLRVYLIERRRSLQALIMAFPEFAASHQPVAVPADAPPLARSMAEAAQLAGVGPMAAVAGCFAELAGRYLLRQTASHEVIVENGGDIFVMSRRQRVVGVFCGEDSPFHQRLAVRLAPGQMPCGVCTSSGTVGPSFSYGKADAALIIAGSAVLADAAATAAGNMVQSKEDVQMACDRAMTIPGVRAALIVCQDRLAAAGEIELVSI
ncbi:MAG: UPF0280 family protein [Clostridia bacterium]|nr:UPF0280 family protein [Clostridia bacterium]